VIGLAIGVGLSMLQMLQKVAFPPHVAVLGVVRDGKDQVHYRNVRRFTGAEQLQGVLLLRVDAGFT
jgi:MFS superfamily sulfate permease-like transporter